MFNNLTIKQKILGLSIFIIIIISGALSLNSVSSMNSFSQKSVDTYSSQAYQNKEIELKNYISLAMKTVQSYHERTSIEKIKVEVQDDLKGQTNFLFSILEAEYKKFNGVLSEKSLKMRLKEIVESSRYGESGYFWINDLDAVIVMHPIKAQLNGKNLYDYKDKGGKQIFKEFAAVAKANGDGFVDYVWPKPGFETPQPKVSYVKLFEPFGWVIGTGEYVSDVTTKMKAEALKTISEMRFGEDGYFWINDSNPKMIMHPIKPSLDGKDLSNVVDKAGKKLFVEFAKVANEKQEGGLVEYMWPKPGFEKPQVKFSYVQKFEPWDWVIGTGAYVTDIEAEISVIEKATEKTISEVVFTTLIFGLIAIVIAIIIYSFVINRTITVPFNLLNSAIKDMTNSNENENKKIEKISNDEVGQLVDNFNGYIQKLQDGVKEDAKVIEEVDDVITKVINGFYVYKIENDSDNPLVKKLKHSINSMIEETNQNLITLNNILIEYGNSNFTENASNSIDSSKVSGVVSSIISSTRLVGATVSEFLTMITQSGRKLNDDTKILSKSSEELSASANQQAAALEETAASVEEITSIIKSNVASVKQMSNLASELQSSSSQGQNLASKTTIAMEEIDSQVKSINDAITVIDQIAFQTNILSLNAAVEAATAGEAGKGFAVVAQEVRNLANRSAEAAREIKNIVEIATTKANEGKDIANEMIGGYNNLNEKINQTIELIANVSDSSKEEEKGIIQINDTINDLDKATQVNANSATVISNLASEVSSLSENLLAIADRAKFNEKTKQEVEDVDLVFKVAKLKNDHIKFKNTNFDKLGTTNTSWQVTKPTECDLGKWILEQQNLGKEFTKTSNWQELKKYHDKVHNSVQEYVDQNAKDKNENNVLLNISTQLDSATSNVFRCLDQIKRDNKVEEKEVKALSESSQKQTYTPKVQSRTNTIKTTQSSSTSFEPKKPTIIKPTENNDDEWESF